MRANIRRLIGDSRASPGDLGAGEHAVSDEDATIVAGSRRRRAAVTLGISLLGSLAAAVIDEIGIVEFADLVVALPVLLLAGSVSGARWAVLAYYFVGRGVLGLAIQDDPQRSLMFALFALTVWLAAREHVDAAWRAVWTVRPATNGARTG